MPPTKPPPPWQSDAAIAEIRDAQGRVVGTVKPTAEFLRWMQALLNSLNSAS